MSLVWIWIQRKKIEWETNKTHQYQSIKRIPRWVAADWMIRTVLHTNLSLSLSVTAEKQKNEGRKEGRRGNFLEKQRRKGHCRRNKIWFRDEGSSWSWRRSQRNRISLSLSLSFALFSSAFLLCYFALTLLVTCVTRSSVFFLPYVSLLSLHFFFFLLIFFIILKPYSNCTRISFGRQIKRDYHLKIIKIISF